MYDILFYDMKSTINQFILLNNKDNTLTALLPLSPGHEIELETENKNEKLILRDPIPYAHKFARRNIDAGEDIIKYGEVIGVATASIFAGCHVHVHNVKGKRA